jgi:CBS domain containing-hemolysin-like protein
MIGLIVLLVVLIAILTIASYADRVYAEAGKFLSREFQENIDVFEQKLEPKLGVSRERAALTMAVLTPLAMAGIGVLLAYFVMRGGSWNWEDMAQLAVEIVLIVVIFHRLLPFIFFSRTKGEWFVGFAPVLRVLIYLTLPITLFLGFCQSVAALTKEHSEPEPENSSEAVDALIEAGQEEGILEESDRELIQSVVEFGDKTVREVMTARPDITAVPVSMTVDKFTELLKSKPLSRIPVYGSSLDNIVGIVFAHDVLQVADSEAHTKTVGDLMHTDVQFVPETKRVNDLLRDMQKDNVHMEIVIDEYGGVAGLVTMEDLVEQIVGEIRDEREAKSDVVKEDANTYVVPGNLDVDRLDDLFGVKPENTDATTVAGLVSELLGRIPKPGEFVDDDGLRFEVLQSTDRRIERLRIRHKEESKDRVESI